MPLWLFVGGLTRTDMAIGTIEIVDGAVRRTLNGQVGQTLPLAPALAALGDWARRYDKAVIADSGDDLIRIGREMFDWLDADGWASDWEGDLGHLELEIRASPRDESAEAILLDAPWELLAASAGHLAGDAVRLFVVSRKIGAGGLTRTPRHADIRLMFMAAAPDGPSVLDFEAEEAAIVKATTGDGNIQLVVEETGTLEELGRQLVAAASSYDALHLSCHGDVDDNGPFLLLETIEGESHRVYPQDLVEAFGPAAPALLMLSACRTAQREMSTPFVRNLAVLVSNVIGWGGSVYDDDAIAFAARFYAELGRRSPVPQAAAYGRRELLRRKVGDPQMGRHWHLARVYLGPGGGGAICEGGRPSRRPVVDRNPRAFLDKAHQRIPVASSGAFVGRRRALQAILRGLRTHEPGILIHGMGAIGKSSVAARIASRVPLRTCVIFDDYDAPAICDAIIDMLPPDQRAGARAIWRDLIAVDSEALGDALEAWLEGPLDDRPILLIIDDLERILEAPAQGEAATQVKPNFRASLAAVLKAFSKTRTASRLLITSRYDFALTDSRARDLARHLLRLPLAPMQQLERLKQLRAAQHIAGASPNQESDEARRLTERALASSGGNPGLQAVLTMPILRNELTVAAEALRQVESYLTTGVPASEIQDLMDRGLAKDHENAVVAFFARLSLATYRDALTADERKLLSATTLFTAQLPVPGKAIVVAGAALGCERPEPALSRLLGLGLVDYWGLLPDVAHFAANPLARPLAATLDEPVRRKLARKVLPLLLSAWKEPVDGRRILRTDPRALEAATLAIEARARPKVIEATATAAAAWLERHERRTREALDVLKTANANLPPDHRADPQFVRIGVECADRLGETDALQAFMDRKRRKGWGRRDLVAYAQLDIRIAEQLVRQGKLDRAVAMLEKVVAAARKVGHDHTALFAKSRIVNALYQRGDYDAAMEILSQQLLPGFTALDDMLGQADTLAEIARIRLRHGDLDESLRLQREEILPRYRRLGDERSCAVTMGAIADVLEVRGDYREVLRIRREELAVYEKLGSARERLLTLNEIASLHEQLGEISEALRIRRDEVVPAYIKLDDARGRAIAEGELARVLALSGEADEALRLREESELPVYLRAGDERMAALCRMEIANLLKGRGDEEEALRVLRDQVIPVLETQGNLHNLAIALGRFARCLTDLGEPQEALNLLRDRVLPICEQLGGDRQRAITLGAIGEALFQSGQHEEAVRLLIEEELPIYERIGDKRSYEITQLNIESMRREMAETD